MADPRILALRRPETTDRRKFWYISQERWEELIAEVLTNPKIALNNLRKFDSAGRIMETDEGTVAPYPCTWCERERGQEPCKVFANESEKACAYCRRMGKSGCTARLHPATPSLKDRVVLLETKLAAAEKRIEDQTKELERQSQVLDEHRGWINTVAAEFTKICEDFTTVWNHLWPS